MHDSSRPPNSPHHHGHHDGPLVHKFEEGPEFWRKKLEEPGRDASQRPQEVVKAMALSEGMVVADVGAGTGYFMQHLADAVGPSGRVLAVDIEPTMVRYLVERAAQQGHGNVEPRLALTDDPLLGKAQLDRILIVNTWHHIPERAAYVAKLRAALKPSGEVWVVDFNMTTSRGPDKEHRLPPATVIAELETAGLVTRLDETLLPDQYIAIGKAE